MTVTLGEMRQEFRYITGRYSQAQYTDAQIDKLINQFYTLHFPEEFRNIKLTSPYTITTVPLQDSYPFPYEAGTFGSNVVTQGYFQIMPPVYCQGYILRYFQDNQIFYNTWPKLTNFFQVGTTNGGTTYSGTIPFVPIQRASLDIAGNLIESAVYLTAQGNGFTFACQDGPPIVGNVGTLFGPNIDTTQTNTINYQTGAYQFTTKTPLPSGLPLNVQAFNFVASRPVDMLFYNYQIVLRPVPADVYQIEFTVSRQPTQLIQANQFPELDDWYLYITLGAARLFYIQNPDPERLQAIEAQLDVERCKANRRTLRQMGQSQRMATIFSVSPRNQGMSWMGWQLPGAQ